MLSLFVTVHGTSEDLEPTWSKCKGTVETIDEQFTSTDTSTWKYANGSYVDQFAPCYYMLNHTSTNTKLSDGSVGLQMLMSDVPCKFVASECHGAAMASAHLSTTRLHGYGDYEARLRAPHNYPGDGSKCDDGIYGYFTAGYVNKECGTWNEMNFGFHPDRDLGGTQVSVELHADTGGYKEANVSLGFNYREGFHTYRIKHRECDVSWWVDGKRVHALQECLTQPMHTSLILRTNKGGALPSAKMEVPCFRSHSALHAVHCSHRPFTTFLHTIDSRLLSTQVAYFKFTPASDAEVGTPAAASVASPSLAKDGPSLVATRPATFGRRANVTVRWSGVAPSASHWLRWVDG
jgi:hypothetical protein